MQINRTALSKQTFALRAFAFAFALVSPIQGVVFSGGVSVGLGKWRPRIFHFATGSGLDW